MQISRVPFHDINKLAYKDVYYQEHTDQLKDFIQFQPTIEGLKAAADTRKEYPVNRTILQEVLADQYKNIPITKVQAKHIEKLKDENTFTIVTAHQPSLLGGPGYYFYKIYSVLHLATLLNKTYPAYHFVPVFINGAEDHDFDEVKSVNLFGKTITWDNAGSGSVGRFTTEGLQEVIEEFSKIIGNTQKAEKINSIFIEALKNADNYNEFVKKWVNAFFSKYGLIVLNMDDSRLKRAFIPVMQREITEQISQTLVTTTQESLEKLHNFTPQAYVRDINLFYINDHSRERLYKDGNLYKVNNSNLQFTEQEMIQHLNAYPERFSPNVVMRPIFEEYTLPNLAYIGGGGELAYWLERKRQFQAFNVFYPVLIRRNSVLFLPKYIQKTMDKLGLKESDIWKDEHQLINEYIEKNTDSEFILKQESKAIMQVFFEIAEKAKHIDPTLEPSVLAEAHKTVKTVENLENRIKRSIKKAEETQLNQLKNFKSKLFPNNNLQERVESYLPFWINEEYDMDEVMLEHLNPLQKEFLIFYL
jgi:bacillithiol biosynthesis cysteine-adding enzyme BshC